MDLSYPELLERIDKGKQEFLDLLEWWNLHNDDEPMYEFFIGLDESEVMEFVERWDYDVETFEKCAYEFADWLDEKEKALV